MKHTEFVALRMEAATLAALDAAAEAAGKSRSAQIRAALVEHLDLEAREPAA